MPIYEYACDNEKCYCQFELVLSMADCMKPVGDACEVCNDGKLVKVMNWGGQFNLNPESGMKVDNGFKEVLAKIEEAHPAGSYGRFGQNKSTPLELFEAKMGKKYSVGVDSRESSINMKKVEKKKPKKTKWIT